MSLVGVCMSLSMGFISIVVSSTYAPRYARRRLHSLTARPFAIMPPAYSNASGCLNDYCWKAYILIWAICCMIFFLYAVSYKRERERARERELEWIVSLVLTRPTRRRCSSGVVMIFFGSPPHQKQGIAHTFRLSLTLSLCLSASYEPDNSVVMLDPHMDPPGIDSSVCWLSPRHGAEVQQRSDCRALHLRSC